MSTAGSSSSAAQIVRMSLRPPTRFSPGGDLELWLTHFEMHAKHTNIPEEQWTCELLLLLEDEPFEQQLLPLQIMKLSYNVYGLNRLRKEINRSGRLKCL